MRNLGIKNELISLGICVLCGKPNFYLLYVNLLAWSALGAIPLPPIPMITTIIHVNLGRKNWENPINGSLAEYSVLLWSITHLFVVTFYYTGFIVGLPVNFIMDDQLKWRPPNVSWPTEEMFGR